MYFVDRDKIEVTLQFLDKQLQLFQETKEWQTALELAGLERIAHLIIESILDVGNSMIDGFIMRDPGSYEDIVDILLDEKVITKHDEESLKSIIAFRKVLVQNYTEIQHQAVKEAYDQHLPSLLSFSSKVRDYLSTELGPVSAFKN